MRGRHTCPWWFAYTFDNPLRGLVHRPRAIFDGLVSRGDTVVDVGCGLGFFTMALAELVGPDGRVVAVDLQPEMLARARRRAERRDLQDRIEFRPCTADRLGIPVKADFVLAFWMVHEVADRGAFLSEVRSLLQPSGRLLIAEPKGHVPPSLFERITGLARDAGFSVTAGPQVALSRSILCTPGS